MIMKEFFLNNHQFCVFERIFLVILSDNVPFYFSFLGLFGDWGIVKECRKDKENSSWLKIMTSIFSFKECFAYICRINELILTLIIKAT